MESRLGSHLIRYLLTFLPLEESYIAHTILGVAFIPRVYFRYVRVNIEEICRCQGEHTEILEYACTLTNPTGNHMKIVLEYGHGTLFAVLRRYISPTYPCMESAIRSGLEEVVNDLLQYFTVPPNSLDTILHELMQTRNNAKISRLKHLARVFLLKFKLQCSDDYRWRLAALGDVTFAEEFTVKWDSRDVFYACTHGRLSMVKHLLRYNLRIPDGALNFAIRRCHPSIVTYLISRGCKISIGHLCIGLCTRRDMLVILLQAYGKPPPGWLITRSVKYGLVEVMVEFGGVPTPKTLERLCRHGDIKMVTKLLSITTSTHVLPEACRSGNVELVSFFYQRGYAWRNGFDLACRFGHLHVVMYAYTYHAPYTLDGINQACHNNHRSIVEYLCHRGIYPTKYGITHSSKEVRGILQHYMNI